MRTLLLLMVALLLAACSTSPDDTDGGGDASGEDSPEAAVDVATFDDDDRAPVEVVHDAVDATLSAGSFRIDSEIEMTILFQQLGLSVSGAADYDELVSDMALEVEQSGNDAEIEVLADGETLWARTDGGQVPPVPEGKTWVEGEASRLEGDQFGPTGVAGVVLLLLGADEVEAGAVEEVDGVPAREFRTTFTYQDALDAAGDRVEDLQSAFSLTGDGTGVDLETVVWVGADDVIRDFDVTAAPEDLELDASVDLELREVDQPVAPPERPEDAEVLTGDAAATYLDQLMR